jgi:hypothetical protein
MHIYFFEYNGQRFSLNISNQTVKNEKTGEVMVIKDLRDLALIRAAHNRLFSISKVIDRGN